MTDHFPMRLGKRPRRRDERTLKLARYLTGALPPAPAAVDYTQGVTDWGVMLNDRLGCCTIAAVGHAVQTWKLNAGAAKAELGAGSSAACAGSPAARCAHGTDGSELGKCACGGGSKAVVPVAHSLPAIPDSTILEYYAKWDGYNPADPGSDQGGVEIDVLNDWRQQEFAGHPLDAYVAIDLRDSSGSGAAVPAIAAAIWLFGGAYIGVELPVTAQNQDVWDVPASPGPDDEPGSWGGHAVYVVGYDLGLTMVDGRWSIEKPPANSRPAITQAPSKIVNRQSTISCITWGQPKKMTLAWFEKYCSEAYALVSKDWLNAGGISPSGFDLATLERDLAMVTS